jgi:hypothetical protein
MVVIILQLTKKTRAIRITNMLTRSEDVINVCQEETIADILERYMEYNQHAKSYTWKALIGDQLVTLNMNKTLEENNVVDESKVFYDLGMNDDYYLPTLHIYFNDDLTIS